MLRQRARVGGLARRYCASSAASSSATTPPDDEKEAPSGSSTTSFGFRTVPEEDKERLVGNVFHSVASNYDVMNDLMSGGMHRVWKDIFVGELGVGASARQNLQVLDVAGGTGDIAFRIADGMAAARPAAAPAPADVADADTDDGPRIVVSDINTSMLEEGRKRASELNPSRTRRWPKMEWVVADAERLPFGDEEFDVYTIAFGIRNVTRIDAALREAHRVLRPGGRFLCLEFSKVTNPLLRAAYEKYSFSVIPEIGRAVASDAASYQYLVESIQKFPDQEAFAALIEDAGFAAVTHTDLTAGVVAVHSGVKLPHN